VARKRAAGKTSGKAKTLESVIRRVARRNSVDYPVISRKVVELRPEGPSEEGRGRSDKSGAPNFSYSYFNGQMIKLPVWSA
jgi:hypothetical protein